MEEINRFYIKKTDFRDKFEFQEHLNKLINTLVSVESNIVVAYQSMDPNVYVVECNITDPLLNNVFPFWVTPDELLSIKQYREMPKDKDKSTNKSNKKKSNDLDDDDGFNGFNGGLA